MKDFTLHQLTVQLHYAPAYLFWDRAGEITRRTTRIWPDWKVEKAEPGTVSGRSPNAHIAMGLETSYVNVIGPRGFSGFSEQISNTLSIWIRMLEIDVIAKIGARAIYSKTFKDQKDAAKAYRNFDLVKWPTRRVFDCASDSDLNGGGVHFQFENDDAATSLRIGPQNLKLAIGPNDDFPDIETTKTLDRVVIDIDRQTKKGTDASRFNAGEWLKGYQHLINRDLPAIIGDV